jgi:hypothetical protein
MEEHEFQSILAAHLDQVDLHGEAEWPFFVEESDEPPTMKRKAGANCERGSLWITYLARRPSATTWMEKTTDLKGGCSISNDDLDSVGFYRLVGCKDERQGPILNVKHGKHVDIVGPFSDEPPLRLLPGSYALHLYNAYESDEKWVTEDPPEKPQPPYKPRIVPMLKSGQLVKSYRGRKLSPYPKVSTCREETQSRVDEWLLREALSEYHWIVADKEEEPKHIELTQSMIDMFEDRNPDSLVNHERIGLSLVLFDLDNIEEQEPEWAPEE